MSGQFGIPNSQMFFHSPAQQMSNESRHLSVGGSSSDKEPTLSFQFVGFQFPPFSTQLGVESISNDNNEGNGRRPNKVKVTWTHDDEICLAQA